MIACGSRYRNSLGRDKLNALNKLNAMFFPYQWSKCVVYKLLQVTSTEGTIPTTLKCCIGWPTHPYPLDIGTKQSGTWICLQRVLISRDPKVRLLIENSIVLLLARRSDLWLWCVRKAHK